jgi:hypothetical protein
MEWQVTTEKVAEIIDFYTSCIGPLVSKSPDTCRLRLLELENATLLQGLSHETKDKAALHTYLALAEFETEEWPWDIAFELSENKQWQHYFEKQEDVVSREYTYRSAGADIGTEMASQSLSCKKTLHRRGRERSRNAEL